MIEYPTPPLRVVETNLVVSVGRQGNTCAHEKTQCNKLESWSQLFVRRFLEWLVRCVHGFVGKILGSRLCSPGPSKYGASVCLQGVPPQSDGTDVILLRGASV